MNYRPPLTPAGPTRAPPQLRSPARHTAAATLHIPPSNHPLKLVLARWLGMGAWRTWFSRAHLAFVFPQNVRSCEREGSGSYLGSPEHHRVPSEYLIPEADDVHGLPGCIGNGVGTATGTDLSIAVQHERISCRGLADAVLYHSFVHNSGPDATVLIGVLLWWLEIVGPSQASDSAPQRARLSPSKTAIVAPQPWRPC